MKADVIPIGGGETRSMELPLIFETPFRRDIIHKVYVSMDSHRFQPQGRHPSAGMDVSADTNDPPTGRGVSRVARASGGGGGRQGQGAEVASTRGGRQAHPPVSHRTIHKRINRKERRLALCSAIAATASADIVRSRGHHIDGIESFPIVVSDDIERVSRTSAMLDVLESLNLTQDLDRLEDRRARSGRSLLRGRRKKTGRSVLFVVRDGTMLSRGAGSLPGVEVREVGSLSVLDLAPGSDPIRLVVYSEGAISEISKIQSTHLDVMGMMR